MENNQLIVTEENKLNLLSVSKWGRFLGIIGYILVAIMVLTGVSVTLLGGIIGALLASSTGNNFPFPFALFGILYLLIAALYFLPIHFMYKMATNLKYAVESNNQLQLNLGFLNMAKSYRFSGYMVISIMALYVLGIIGVIGFSAYSASKLKTANIEIEEKLDSLNQMDYSTYYDSIEEEMATDTTLAK